MKSIDEMGLIQCFTLDILILLAKLSVPVIFLWWLQAPWWLWVLSIVWVIGAIGNGEEK